MRAGAAKATAEPDELGLVLENPPAGFRDPDSDGHAAPTADLLAWRIYCMAGAHVLPEEVAGAKFRLAELRGRLDRAVLQRAEVLVASLAPAVESAEQEVRAKEAMLAAVGGWPGAGLQARMDAAAEAERRVRDADEEQGRYTEARHLLVEEVREFGDKVMAKRAGGLREALQRAQAARAELLALVDGDRAKLAALRVRRVA